MAERSTAWANDERPPVEGKRSLDAVIVGAGPNGLSAAIELARSGWSVRVYEAAPVAGGGVRSAELTLPGFVHDVCSAVHPMAVDSPFFRSLSLERHGVDWVVPDIPLAHPLDGGSAVAMYRSVSDTCALLEQDARSYARLVTPFLKRWHELLADALGPVGVPRHPIIMLRLGAVGLWPAATLARLLFATTEVRALFAGLAAHGVLPLEAPLTSAFGLMLQVAGHAGGWPFPRGGAQRLTDALVAELRGHGGELVVGEPVDTLDSLPPSRAVLCDVSPSELVRIAGPRLPGWYAEKLSGYRHGPGAFKIDWALDAPIPWTADTCRRAGVVHLGGTIDEVAEGERLVARGDHPDRPFVLLAQPSLFDTTRAPNGRHTAWAYCHVPNGSTRDMTAVIEAQVERFAPGFRSRVLARHTMTTSDFARQNRNLVGGDFSGGANDVTQMLWRPTARAYRTPAPGLYLCSASTPPGGGVHGMCGVHAAHAAIRDLSR